MKRYTSLSLSAALLLSVGCTPERRTTYVVEASLLSEDRQAVDDARIYLYNADSVLFGHQEASFTERFDLTAYQSVGGFKMVAWGNVRDEGQRLSPVEFGDSISAHSLLIDPSNSSFAGIELAKVPADLFYGTLDARFGSQYEDYSIGTNRYILGYLQMRRVVAKYDITIRNSVRAFGDRGGHYSVLVKHPSKGLDFAAEPIAGQTATLNSHLYDVGRDEIFTYPIFALSTGESALTVELYSGTELLYSTTVDRAAESLNLKPRRWSHFLIDFAREIDVAISPPDWDEEAIEQGF